jgi:TPR repeat protein
MAMTAGFSIVLENPWHLGGTMRRRGRQFVRMLLVASALVPTILPRFPSVQLQAQIPAKGIDPALLAKAKAGNADAEFALGLLYDHGQGVPQDSVQAAFWYRKAADRGYAKAQNNLGILYANGDGIAQDYAQATTWWRKAADQGSAQSQNNLGGAYYGGQGVRQDYAQAATWWRKAAEQGDIEAQTNLGSLYDSGQGVPQDYTQAAAWWRKAADQNGAGAQYHLGLLYDKGQGVPLDYAEAYYWMDIAAASEIDSVGPEEVDQSRDEAASHLTPAELSREQERARQWLESHPAGSL